MITGVDTAYPQGNSGGNGAFNITCATRANVGLQVDSGYHARVDNTLGNRELGHYHFNDASIDPLKQADYFTGNLYRFAPGQLVALDVEYEVNNGVTVTQAMNPDQAALFFDRLENNLGIPYGGMAAYINRSIRSQWDWSPVWERGVRKWIASPSTDPGDWDIWQFGIVNNVDQDYSQKTFAEFYGVPTKQIRKTEVFKFSYKGWFGIAVPSGNPSKPLHAIVLGGQDVSDTMPYVGYNWSSAYQQLYDMLDNPGNVPTP